MRRATTSGWVGGGRGERSYTDVVACSFDVEIILEGALFFKRPFSNVACLANQNPFNFYSLLIGQ